MICPTIGRVFLIIGLVALSTAPVRAQLALPGAAPAAPAGAAAAPLKVKKAAVRKSEKSSDASKAEHKFAPGVESIDGRPLMLNGGTGLMQVSGGGDRLQVDKLSLAGEGVSDPSQRCVVNIVGEKPIAASKVGRPEGLDRYEVDVPACPFAFDVVDGAVLIPAQITACVFRAADCQTSPSGLWGPDGALLAGDVEAVGKRRTGAENAMSRALHALEERAKDNPDAANLVRDQRGFAGERDDICRDYVKESTHGFCAATVTEARAALLEARLAALPGAGGDKTAKSDKPARHKKAKAAAADAGAVEKPQ